MKEILDDPSEVSNDSLIGLEQRGCNLKPRPDVESGLSRLRGLRMTMDQWETRASSCLQVYLYMDQLETRTTRFLQVYLYMDQWEASATKCLQVYLYINQWETRAIQISAGISLYGPIGD